VPLLAFDCDTYSNPLQVLKYQGASQYSIRELDLDTGDYTLISTFDLNMHINAVAMYGGRGTLYAAFGEFGGLLCNFDLENRVCFSEKLKVAANAGAIIANDYYYAKSPGATSGTMLYWVESIEVTAPIFHEGAFTFSTSLFEDAVLDFAPIHDDGETYVDDGDSSARYLVGLGWSFETVIIRVAATGEPTGYAVFESNVEWAARTASTDSTLGFGAAYTYNTDSGQKALMSANAGFGLFEVLFPIAVAESCWNSGSDTADHKLCTSDTPTVLWRFESLSTSSNDGMNCPDAAFTTSGATASAKAAAKTAEAIEVDPAAQSDAADGAPTRAPTADPAASGAKRQAQGPSATVVASAVIAAVVAAALAAFAYRAYAARSAGGAAAAYGAAPAKSAAQPLGGAAFDAAMLDDAPPSYVPPRPHGTFAAATNTAPSDVVLHDASPAAPPPKFPDRPRRAPKAVPPTYVSPSRYV